MDYGLIGEKLGHSFSKVIHERLFNYSYELCELAPDELDAFLKKRDFRAINVTIPYKQAVIPYLSYIDPLAEKIGAVNTVVNRDGKLYGYNTDALGMTASFKYHGVSLRGKNVLILGSGGTSLTAKAVCEDLGAKKVIRTSRSEKDDCVTYDNAVKDFSDAQIIINTTPLGMYPNLGNAAANLDDFPVLEAVADAVYNPLFPTLTVRARERGIKAFGGLYMLVAQAAKAAEYFVGESVCDKRVNAIYRELFKNKQNLVLVGMPSCGKSTIGRMLADELDRPFIDTDEEIVKREGKQISDIFKEVGEKGFRDIESAVIRDLAPTQGAVISTGGGAILRRENVENLKQNGFVVFIDRPLELLTPTSDRPLSSNLEALKARYAEREPIYRGAADATVNNSSDISSAINAIREAFLL